MGDADVLLSVRQLVTGFDGARARHPVHDVSFEVKRNGVLGLVGESGAGKSLTALSILRLLPPGARVLGGEVWFEGRNLLELGSREMQELRGRQLAIAFQEPATALSPVHTVGSQLGMAFGAAGQRGAAGWFGRRATSTRGPALELLRRVELPDPERILETYPHQLSAGMRRRVSLALALAQNPTLLIADEPTTGLDASSQAQILDLLASLAREGKMSAIFISHDLSALAAVASDVAVMYDGEIVESGPTRSVFARPQHPYTLSLLESVSRPRAALARPSRSSALERAELAPDRSGAHDPGCRYRARCALHRRSPDDFPRCRQDAPALGPGEARHRARCFYPRLGEREDEDQGARDGLADALEAAHDGLEDPLEAEAHDGLEDKGAA